MQKYQRSGRYGSKQRYNRSMKDVYRSLQNLYKRIEQLQRYRTSGGPSSGSYGYRPRMMSPYQSERHPEKYKKEKVEPRYVVKTEPPKYKIDFQTRQTNAEQIAEETEKRIETKLKPLIENIESKLSEHAEAEVEKPENKLHAQREHTLELMEFAGRDWEESDADRELFWELQQAFERTVENRLAEFKLENPNEPEPGDLVGETKANDMDSLPLEKEMFKIEPEPISAAIHGTESSTELKLSPEAEFRSDEVDFLALETELFGIENEIETVPEDATEGAPFG